MKELILIVAIMLRRLTHLATYEVVFHMAMDTIAEVPGYCSPAIRFDLLEGNGLQGKWDLPPGDVHTPIRFAVY